jgi:hypothetical protein
MSFFKKMFNKDTPAPEVETKTANPTTQLDDDVTHPKLTTTSGAPLTTPEPLLNPASGPAPPAKLANALGTGGMGAGMATSMVGAGGSMGGDMLGGQIVGNFVGQRIDQAKSHAYWKERQGQYLAGDETAVVTPGVQMTEREAKRAEKRKKRWDSRAGRS